MISPTTAVGSFTEFVKNTEPRLRHALSAAYGLEVGRDATAEALAYGWEHWERVQDMENPAGYLFRIGKSRARSLGRGLGTFPQVDTVRWPWVEPGLPRAVDSLSQRQRTVVLLLHCFAWTYAEVADVLKISRGSVQRHEQRALRKLRNALGVRSDA
jgi:RNA polymerase sigma-70 factor (ECF subfamily)